MPSKNKTREITITDDEGTFSVLFKKFTNDANVFDFDGLTSLRRLLSNERAKLLHVLKLNKPKSIYGLSKLLGRDFKSVSSDIKLLERFGFVTMESQKTGNRSRLKPSLSADTITIKIKV